SPLTRQTPPAAQSPPPPAGPPPPGPPARSCPPAAPRAATSCRPEPTLVGPDAQVIVLAAAQRLRRSTDFAAAIRGGRRVGRGTVVVHLLIEEPASAPEARAGFVVSKAVGNAVVRNRVRRRLRHL